MMNRRQFLTALGLTGAALTFPSLRKAQSEPSTIPKRFIMISSTFGWTYDTWKMRTGGKTDDTFWELDLRNIDQKDWSKPLAPFFPHRERLLALDGISLATAELDVDGDRHPKGWLQAWTGNWAYLDGSRYSAQTPSIDQLIARHLAREDRLPSIEMSVYGNPRTVNHAGWNLGLPMQSSPVEMWQRLFGAAQSPDPLVARQKSVLDFATAEHKALASKLNGDDRKRLDRHYELVRNLERRITGMSQAQCQAAPKPSQTGTFDETFEAFMDMTAAAFSCDLTRVASFSLGEIPPSEFGWSHVTDATHKGLAHEIYNSAIAHEAMTDYIVKHAQQIALLVEKLSSIKEADGSSLMDHTMIVWGSENADGWHGYLNYTPVILGGNWHFKTGRYIHWPHETPVELLHGAAPSSRVQRCGKPHQHLLVSLAQAMGMKVDKVGIDHFQSKQGDKVICSGPLPNLT